MNQKKLLLFLSCIAIAILVIGGLIGFFLRIINEVRYTLEYILPYWLVSPFILIILGLITACLVQYGWPLWLRFLKKRNQNTNISVKKNVVPKTRHQAAKQSLQSIDQILIKLNRDISSQGLKTERERVAKELSRGDLVVVVFGSGSSGKTSLIRALLNEIVGQVGSQMGSTKTSQTYRLRLKGLNRGLQLIDTPGIFEAGVDGRSREKEAKVRASRADLMIIVVDSDLRLSEIEVIKSLSNLGKRLLLVLNKCDLRGEREEQRLLELLRSHSKGLIDSKDVLAISASPQSIPRPGKRPLQPPPEVESLLKRLALVLYTDGEELIADNILLQCRSLGKAGRQLLNSQRKNKAKKCIDRYSWIGSGVVLANPIPGSEFLGTAAVNAQMIIEVAKVYGIKITLERAQELAISLGKTLAGLGIVRGGLSLIGSALSLNLPTLLAGRFLQAIVAAWLTRVAGASFITYFEQDQDWGDGGMQEVVQHHYDVNRRESNLKNFIEMAFKNVVEPIQRDRKRQLPPRSKPRGEEATLDHEHPEL